MLGVGRIRRCNGVRKTLAEKRRVLLPIWRSDRCCFRPFSFLPLPPRFMVPTASRFTPAGVDSRLAEKMRNNAVRQTAFPFTPAGLSNRTSNTLTVAARADASNAVSMRTALAQMEAGTGTTLRLNNSSYQLTAARGWQAFSLPPTVAEQPRLDTILGKGDFRLDDSGSKKPSRFNTDASAGDYSVNVGGSFRVAKGVDVTAGVRYSRDSDRVEPAAETRADNEAVYVGTKIKF
jgi:hypothetical protein